MAYSYTYPRPSVTVDCVVFGTGQAPAVSHSPSQGDPSSGVPELQILLVRRRAAPCKGLWALPGGFVQVTDDGDQGEDLEAAAHRELAEETGVKVDYLEQLYTFGAPGRDARGRVITVAYYALVRSTEHPAHAASDASDARFFPVSAVLRQRSKRLAFDHAEILAAALRRLQAKVRYAPIGFNLLPPRFSLTELQGLYEAILQRRLDKRNFRKRILATGILAEAGTQKGVPHRAATLYRLDKLAYDTALREGFSFEL